MDISWESVIGHEVNKKRLQTLLAEDRMPHALLFCGPEGTGKRRLAGVLAAALLCSSVEGRPCGHCDSCRSMQADTHPDFYLVEPESRGKSARSIRIEQIRAMETEIARVPILAARRVVLIDEAELMNEAAANSLLKTLEEPSGQTVFILVTSARSSLLDTIISRCTPVNFGLLTEEELSSVLVRRGVAAAQAAVLAALADGSAGRAMRLSEEGGLALRDDAMALLRALPLTDMMAVWEQGKRLGALGREPLMQWLRYFRMLLRDMLVLYSGGEGRLYHPDLAAELGTLFPRLPERLVFAAQALTSETEHRLTGSNVNNRLLMEAFLLQLRDLQ